MKTKMLLVAPLSLALLSASCGLISFGGGGGGGGILRSNDSGETWEAANQLEGEATLAGAAVTRLRVDKNDAKHLLISTSSSGGYQSTDGGSVWKRILTGPRLFDMQINPNNSQEIIAGGSAGDLAKAFRSTDGGQTWTEVYSEAKGASSVTSVAYHPVETNIIYLGLSTGELIRSTNGGESWNLFAKLKDRILRVEVLPQDTRIIYALNFNGGLYRSVDSGTTWTQLTDKKVKATNFLDFRTVGRSPSVVYLATSDGLHRSDDRGDTWEKLKLPLHEPTSVVTTVELNQRDPSKLFATIGRTLYSSSDGGVSWRTKELPTTASIRDLVIDQTSTNQMYMALGQAVR